MGRAELGMPLIATLSQAGKLYGQLFSIGVAAKYYITATPDGPHGSGQEARREEMFQWKLAGEG
jgi:hypothetical protein